jgi:ubiquinone/menaquinone biosynthesis C-methylase UbiE
MNNQIDYDQIAPEYNQRYVNGGSTSRSRALLELTRSFKNGSILEAGCGTAHWLADLKPSGHRLYGLDYSAGMLRLAHRHEKSLHLVQGEAARLPFRSEAYDLIYCVDAIHHFGQPRAFITEAYRLLRPGGQLAVLTNDIYRGPQMWYGYQYFDGVYATDLRRFPSLRMLHDFLRMAGFVRISRRVVERLDETRHGRAVLDDPFLKKNASSQLALLSEAAYQTGLERIKAALAQAEAVGRTLVFTSDWSTVMVIGQKPF